MSSLIITDSTAYLSPDIIKQYNIKIVPLNVHLPDYVFKEGQGLTNLEYYALMRNSKMFPTTSQPSAWEFLEAYSQLQPGDEALVILISSFLSGTVQSATMAKEMIVIPSAKVSVIDSLSAAMGLGFQVIKACELLDQGKSISEIEQEILKIRDKMRIFFVVDNLEYLVRGGRVSKLSGLIGNILQLKPVLSLSNGEINLFDKVRTSPKALNRILDELEKDADNLEKIAVIHVDAVDAAMSLQERVAKRFSVPVILTEAGPVIGTHTGPGTLGLIYY